MKVDPAGGRASARSPLASSAPRGAVFLSYASQDARRRQGHGGQASAAQARTERYFRLEWRLADQRTHLMAKGRPFLLPVVIDDPRDAEAHVPDSFTEVQWTRLPGGETPAAFCERVKTLLGGEAEAERVAERLPVPRGAESRSATKQKNPPWLTAVIVVLPIVVGLALVWRLLPDSASQPAEIKRPAPPAARVVVAPQTEVQNLIAQIWKIFELQEGGTLEEWTLADDLGAQAVKFEPNNVDAWAAYSATAWGLSAYGRTSSRITREDASRRIERAMGLAPESDEARFAGSGGKRTTLSATEIRLFAD